MALICKETLWIFLLPSSKEAEERHIYDIAYGTGCLLSLGIKTDDIYVFIDNIAIDKAQGCFERLSLTFPKHIYTTNDLSSLLEHNVHKNAVVFVTGHGSPNGLDAPHPMQPYNIYRIFHMAKNMEQAVFFFGQCYAGIFNYMPISAHLGLSDAYCKRITAIGATGLFSSISSTVIIGKAKWNANIFLMAIYTWLLKQYDIDGDGKPSVMDAFKFASIETNERLREIKLSETMQSIIEQATLQQSLVELKTTGGKASDDKMLEIQALCKRLEIRYIEQTPWVLNAQVAMSTVF